MVLLKLALLVIVITFVFSAVSGIIAFIFDVIRFPQRHEKVNPVPSSEVPDSSSDIENTEEGLILDEHIDIDL